MFNHHYEIMATQKQHEIEQNTKEAWKWTISKQDGLLQRIKATPTKKSRNLDACVTC